MKQPAALAVAILTVGMCMGLAQKAPPPTEQDITTPQAAAKPAPAAPALTLPATEGAGVLPAQTPILLQLETHLSTRNNKSGDGFAARVMKAVFYQGKEVLPAGSILEGHVIQVQDSRPLKGDSSLLLRPDLISTPLGQRYTISAEVIQGDPLNPAKVDSEGALHEPRGMMLSDVRHEEIGASGGAVAGAVLAGSQGALWGGGVGAVIATGIWLVRYRHLDLNPGSQLTVRLDRPLLLIAQPSVSGE